MNNQNTTTAAHKSQRMDGLHCATAEELLHLVLSVSNNSEDTIDEGLTVIDAELDMLYERLAADDTVAAELVDNIQRRLRVIAELARRRNAHSA